MKITGQKKELIENGNPRWGLFMEFQYALSAEKYLITSRSYDDGTSRERTFIEAVSEYSSGRNLDEFDDINQIYYSPDEFEDIIFELQALNMLGNDIYMTPFSDEYFYVVLDDLELSEDEMWDIYGEYLPCLIIGTPTENYQFVMKVRKTEVKDDREGLNRFVRHINEEHKGNKSVGDIIHGFRVPGYSSREPGKECPFIPLIVSDDYYSEKTEAEICKFLNTGNKK